MSTVYDQAAQAFQSGERLYIDDEALTEFAERRHRDRRRRAGRRPGPARRVADTPIFLAVMPSAARTTPVNDLGQATGEHGTYVVLLSPDGRR